MTVAVHCGHCGRRLADVDADGKWSLKRPLLTRLSGNDKASKVYVRGSDGPVMRDRCPHCTWTLHVGRVQEKGSRLMIHAIPPSTQ